MNQVLRAVPAIVESQYQELLALDARVDEAAASDLKARWDFGSALLLKRVGRQLPKGLLDDLVKKTGKSRSELQYRVQFAEIYQTSDEVSNALDTFKSWADFVNRPKEEKPPRSVAPPVFPVGTYGLVYADPPWRYDFSETTSREIENQYPTMEVDDIAALKPPFAPDCVLYLWATAPKLREALRVMESWGFEYLSNAVWVKDKIGMGYWFRGRHELLLVGKRGTMSPPEPAHRPDSVIQAPRTVHSSKPPQVYELLEGLYPDTPRLELFARSTRAGWESWGYEA